MAVTVDATVGGASANSYVTVNEVSTYWANKLGGDSWTDETDADTKAKAVITATRNLDSDYSFEGYRVDTTQALKWPRGMVEKVDPGYVGGAALYYSLTEIPQPIKDAIAELANDLLSGATDAAGSAGLIEMNLGDVLMAKFDGGSTGIVSSRLAALLRGFVLNSSGIPIVRA